MAGRRPPAERTVMLQHPTGPGTEVLVSEERAAVLEQRGYVRTGAIAKPAPKRTARKTPPKAG